MNNKKTLATFLAVALLGSLGQLAQAGSINGTIAIEGGADLDSNNLNVATRVDAWVSPEVTSVSGDFDTFVNPADAVTMTAPWTFSAGKTALWSVGGFTFDLTTSSIVFQGAGFLLVEGTGTASGNGFDATDGMFRFSTQEPDAKGIFSFSASVGTLPDGGMTVMLLGMAFLAITVAKRRFA